MEIHRVLDLLLTHDLFARRPSGAVAGHIKEEPRRTDSPQDSKQDVEPSIQQIPSWSWNSADVQEARNSSPIVGFRDRSLDFWSKGQRDDLKHVATRHDTPEEFANRWERDDDSSRLPVWRPQGCPLEGQHLSAMPLEHDRCL